MAYRRKSYGRPRKRRRQQMRKRRGSGSLRKRIGWRM